MAGPARHAPRGRFVPHRALVACGEEHWEVGGPCVHPQRLPLAEESVFFVEQFASFLLRSAVALRETVEFLRAELGPEVEDWAWGKLHTLTFAHTLGAVKPLDKLFNRGPHPLGGDGTTVWAAAPAGGALGAETIIGPPFRFIADLGDLRNSWGLLAPGQSGQPGSKHYDDQAEAWFTGEYHPMLYDFEDVEREAEACLRLTPDRER